MMRKSLLISLLLVLVLTACQARAVETEQASKTEQSAGTAMAGVTEQAGSYPTPEPFPFPTSERGSISVHGTLLATNPFMMTPDPEDPVFLVPLSGDGESMASIPPFSIGEVPRATVDIRNGEFVFTNIQPGQYAIVVLLTTGSQVPAKYVEGGNLAIINLSESDLDQVVEVEPVGVP